jgi:hypothetical protein
MGDVQRKSNSGGYQTLEPYKGSGLWKETAKAKSHGPVTCAGWVIYLLAGQYLSQLMAQTKKETTKSCYFHTSNLPEQSLLKTNPYLFWCTCSATDTL